MDKKLLALYSTAHFWVDLSCAFLVFRTLAGTTDFILCLLLYNFCVLLPPHMTRSGFREEILMKISTDW